MSKLISGPQPNPVVPAQIVMVTNEDGEVAPINTLLTNINTRLDELSIRISALEGEGQ